MPSHGWKPRPPQVFCRCCDCFGDGWGPMLRTVVWEAIEPDVTILHFPHGRTPGVARKYLCEDCMVVRLGRPLDWYDFRVCPMNYGHPRFQFHNLPDEVFE